MEAICMVPRSAQAGGANLRHIAHLQERVDAAEDFLGAREEGLNLGLVPHVRRHDERARPAAVGGRGRRAQRIGTPTCERHAPAVGQQGEGRRTTDARPRARDDGHFRFRVHGAPR